MAAPRSRAARFVAVALAALAGGFAAHFLVRPFIPNRRPTVRVLPLPHHVPKTPGGVSLRFAMVQDVLTERYARHSQAYYLERNRMAREEISRLPPSGPSDAMSDDLAAGLDQLGDVDGAIKVMRDKLKSQVERGVAESGLYSTHANLGTFLVHRSVDAARAGDAAAKDQLLEGLRYVRKSIELKPDAHFGREKWQASLVEFRLAAIDDPNILLTFDLVGNRLDKELDPRDLRASDSEWVFRARWITEPENGSRPIAELAIQRVGAENGWPAKSIPSNSDPVPFDAPVLGIIGL